MNTYYTTKHQMTQVWDKNGKRLAVTVLDAAPLTVTQVKSSDKDAYHALQVGFGTKSQKHTSKPVAKHLKAGKSDQLPRYLREIRLGEANQDINLKDQITFDQIFEIGDIVNATATTKGRGFAGAIKRWGFSGGPKTHGQSDRHRAVGSIGQGTSPGRVHKGKKMPGHYGAAPKTIKNIQVVHIDQQNHQVWLAGAVPGPTGTVVKLTKIRSAKFPGLDERFVPAVPEPEVQPESTETSEVNKDTKE